MADFIADGQMKNRLFDASAVRNPLFKGGRIGYDDELTFLVFENLADGRGSLDSEGRLVVASLKGLSGIGKEEDPVTLYEVIEVGGAVLSGLLVRKDDHLESVMVKLRNREPSGGKKQSAAEGFRRCADLFG